MHDCLDRAPETGFGRIRAYVWRLFADDVFVGRGSRGVFLGDGGESIWRSSVHAGVDCFGSFSDGGLFGSDQPPAGGVVVVRRQFLRIRVVSADGFDSSRHVGSAIRPAHGADGGRHMGNRQPLSRDPCPGGKAL